MKQTLFVIQELVSREMKRKYSRSKLGILWSSLAALIVHDGPFSGIFYYVPEIY